ncbi:MAG: 50S ribosomal protein L24 [Bacteroidota bacterium]|nr:50S ribosomal protein L24 [Bacteroidota bacterium]MDX5448779.1 50S ribosomal protein L24 [Bacteroidota bacterium]MDX5505709.1 50S ribosomal protein L24 [Bacteroidota bacterium]
MATKFHIKKGDTVKVIAGESKGMTGRVIRIVAEKNRAVVEGVNIVHKHQKPSATSPQGGIIELEAPVHISNLQLVDPKSGDATRVGRQTDDNGKSVRVAKKSGEVIK